MTLSNLFDFSVKDSQLFFQTTRYHANQLRSQDFYD